MQCCLNAMIEERIRDIPYSCLSCEYSILREGIEFIK